MGGNRKKRHPRPRTLGPWKLLKCLGKGGNGVVWEAVHEDGRKVAVKVLHRKFERADYSRYKRFGHEAQLHRSLSGEPGILPVVDLHLPDQPGGKDRAWLATAIATRIDRALGPAPDLSTVVRAVAAVAATLARLHERGISHRDLKPTNLYQYSGDWVLGDFGLASFPGKDAVTVTGEQLGPALFIPPEMMKGENAKSADGAKADVYSLGKTLWVLATGQNYPLPGEHIPQGPGRIASLVSHTRANQLDLLVARATRLDPLQRCTMAEVAVELNAWLAPAVPAASPGDLSALLARIAKADAAFIDADRPRVDRINSAKRAWDTMQAKLREVLAPASVGLMSQYGHAAQGLFHRMSVGIENVEWSNCSQTTFAGQSPRPVILYFMIGAAALRSGDVHLAAGIFLQSGERMLWADRCQAPGGSAVLDRALETLMNRMAEQMPTALAHYVAELEARA